MSLPSFSIVTVCLNAARFIEDTLVSVERQTYRRVEHLIIDGGSTDATLEIVRRHTSCVTVLISEPDAGIYDAMNKGARRATGDYLLFLNADDYFHDETVLEDIAQKLSGPAGPDLLYGGVEQLDPKDGYVHIHQQPFGLRELALGAHPPHQACFFKRETFQALGGYSLTYRVCGDFELILRYYFDQLNVTYEARTVSVFRITGFSSTFALSNLPIDERLHLIRARFGRGSAQVFWLRSRLTLLRKIVREVLMRSGTLRYWRSVKRLAPALSW